MPKVDEKTENRLWLSGCSCLISLPCLIPAIVYWSKGNTGAVYLCLAVSIFLVLGYWALLKYFGDGHVIECAIGCVLVAMNFLILLPVFVKVIASNQRIERLKHERQMQEQTEQK